MMKNYILIIYFIIIFSTFGAAFSNIETAEKKVFGFTLEENGNYHKRLEILEKKLFGKISKEPDIVREEKISDFLFINSDYYSPMRKIETAEYYIFSKNFYDKDILSRIDKIEEKLFGKIENSYSIMERITKIYDYLMLKNQDFRDKVTFKSESEKIKIKLLKKSKYKKGENLNFVLLEDIKGIASKGAIIKAKIEDKSSILKIKNKKIDLFFYEIENVDNNKIKIYKKIKVSEKNITKEIEIENISIVDDMNKKEK